MKNIKNQGAKLKKEEDTIDYMPRVCTSLYILLVRFENKQYNYTCYQTI
jgi:hypothetical protein